MDREMGAMRREMDRDFTAGTGSSLATDPLMKYSSSSMCLPLEELPTNLSQAAPIKARVTVQAVVPLMVACLTTALHLPLFIRAQEKDLAMFLIHHTVTLHLHLTQIDPTGTMYHHSPTTSKSKAPFGARIFLIIYF